MKFAALAVGACTALSACGFTPSHCYTEGEYARFRATEMPVYARAHSYIAAIEIVGECTPSLTLTEAYPGIRAIDPDTGSFVSFSSLVAVRIVDVTWASPGAPDPSDMLMIVSLTSADAGLSDFGLEPGRYDDGQPHLVNAFAYEGARAPGVDAIVTCDDGTTLRTDNTLVSRHWLGSPLSSMEVFWNLPADDLIAQLEQHYEASEQEQLTLSQEIFLLPHAAAIEIVGPVNEVPQLPPRPETNRCDLD